MAFASKGALGVAGDATDNQASLTHTTTTTNCAIGDLVVVVVVVDNHTTTTGDTTDVSGVVDSAGNTYTRAKEYCNAPSGAQSGVDVSIWYCVLTSALNIGGTITASFTSSTDSDASAMGAHCFTVASGSKVGIEGTPANGTSQNGSLDVTTSNIECLRYRASGIESSSNTNWTAATSGWTLKTQKNSGGGTSATEVTMRAEFHISTGTTDPSAPSGGPSGDAAAIYVALKELVRQALTATAATNSNSFGTAVVGRGAVALSPTRYKDSTDSFGPAVVAQTGPQALTATKATNTSTFGTPVVGRGAVSLTAALVTDADTFGTPSIGRGAVNLTGTHYSDADSFGTPSVGRGAVALTGTLYSDADSFGTPTVGRGAVALTGTLYSDADSFGAPTVGRGAVALSATLYGDADSFGAPTVAAGAVALTATKFTDADTFHTAVVGRGAVAVTAPHYTDADSFGTPTVGRGAVTVAPAAFVDADSFGTATITTTVALTGTLFEETNTFGVPIVLRQGAAQASLFEDADVFFNAILDTFIDLPAALYVDPDVFGHPSIGRHRHGTVVDASRQATAPVRPANIQSAGLIRTTQTMPLRPPSTQ